LEGGYNVKNVSQSVKKILGVLSENK